MPRRKPAAVAADLPGTIHHPVLPAVRQASRELVRELGFLTGHLAGTPLTLAKCHALLELESAGPLTASDLGLRLNVDRSCASRTLQQLTTAGLARHTKDRSDARRRPVALTLTGRMQLVRIHRLADSQAQAALDLLDPAARQQVSDGLTLYAKALRRNRLQAAWQIRLIRRADNPAVAGVIREVMTEHGASGKGFSIMDREVDDMHGNYRGPRAAFWVVEDIDTGYIGGVGGFAQLAGTEAKEKICELRKMYYQPELRGLGLGARLMDVVLDAARAAGFVTCYLETLDTMHRARRLYESFGFRPLKGPLGRTGHTSCDSWYSLDLRTRKTTGRR